MKKAFKTENYWNLCSNILTQIRVDFAALIWSAYPPALTRTVTLFIHHSYLEQYSWRLISVSCADMWIEHSEDEHRQYQLRFMTYHVYILYSKRLNRIYVGQTTDAPCGRSALVLTAPEIVMYGRPAGLASVVLTNWWAQRDSFVSTTFLINDLPRLHPLFQEARSLLYRSKF